MSWPGVLIAPTPVLEVGAGRVTPSHHGGPRVLPPEMLDILHKKSCIFLHIGMILVKILVGGHAPSPTKLLGDMSPGFGACG